MIIEKFKYNTMTNNIKFFLLLFMLSNLGMHVVESTTRGLLDALLVLLIPWTLDLELSKASRMFWMKE